MEIKDLYREVKSLPIDRVLSRYVTLHKRAGHYEILCPFHNDKSMGSFIIRPNKNRWDCYCCGKGGDGTEFVSLLLQIPKREAAIQIAEEHKLIDSQTAAAFRKGDMHKTVFKPHPIVKKVGHNPKRDAAHLAKVYTAFVAASGAVSSAHRKYLTQAREVEGWEKDFFEWPNPNNLLFWKRFAAELKKEGIMTSMVRAIQYVPGFCFNLESMKPYFLSCTGIGIVLRDENGKISGLQLRPDDARGGAKYKLFSSSWAEYNDLERPTAFDGASSQQVIDILYPPDKNDIKAAAITEGKFKAIQLAKMGYVVLSINGVNCWSMVITQFLSLVEQLGPQMVHIYFDADIGEKVGVAEAAIELFKAIAVKGFDTYFVVWPKSLGKGIDDMILAGHRKDLRMRRGNSYVKNLERFVVQEKAKQRERMQKLISAKASAYNTTRILKDESK